jgi:hypothetical protein
MRRSFFIQTSTLRAFPRPAGARDNSGFAAQGNRRGARAARFDENAASFGLAPAGGVALGAPTVRQWPSADTDRLSVEIAVATLRGKQ